MKVKHSFLVFAAAFLMVMPAFAKTGVVYQRQDSLRIVSLLQQAKAMKKKPANASLRRFCSQPAPCANSSATNATCWKYASCIC